MVAVAVAVSNGFFMSVVGALEEAGSSFLIWTLLITIGDVDDTYPEGADICLSMIFSESPNLRIQRSIQLPIVLII